MEAIVPAPVLEELAQTLQQAWDQATPVVVRGRGTREDWAPPAPPDALFVGTDRLAGPGRLRSENLTAVFPAGSRLADVRSQLAGEGFWLPLEDLEGDSSLGGCLQAGSVNPLRSAYGPSRDWVLGLTLLDPRGRLLRLGGELVKDVAGYDLTHLHLGAWGRLGLVAEVAVRLLPLPPSQVLLRAEFESAAAAEEALRRTLLEGHSPAACEALLLSSRTSVETRFVGEERAVESRARGFAEVLLAHGAVVAHQEVLADAEAAGRQGAGESTPRLADAAGWAALRESRGQRLRLAVTAPGLAWLAEVAQSLLGSGSWALQGQPALGEYRLFWDGSAPLEAVLPALVECLPAGSRLSAEGFTAARLASPEEPWAARLGWISFPPRPRRSQDPLEARLFSSLAGGRHLNPHLPIPTAERAAGGRA
jgi:hypothetical protein